MNQMHNFKNTFGHRAVVFMLFISTQGLPVSTTQTKTPKQIPTKQEKAAQKKRMKRIFMTLAATVGIGTAAWYFRGSRQPAKHAAVTFEHAHDTAELKQILHNTTYEELTTTLKNNQNPVQLAEQKTSYIKQVTLQDGSIWFLKVAKWPGRVNKHGSFHYVFGSKQNRSRYDMAKKINSLKKQFIHAPKKKLLALKNAGPDKNAWTDKECVVLAPQLPAGSLMLPPVTDPHFAKSKKHFIYQLKDYIYSNPEALEQLSDVIETLGFADGHLGNIALLPHERGLMIYDTEDILQGIEESSPSEGKKVREKWSVDNFLGRTDNQPGIEHIYTPGDTRAKQVLNKWRGRQKSLS